jgi:hypothetical protein
MGFVSVAREKVQDRFGRLRPVMEIAPLPEYGDDERVEKFLFAVARELRSANFPELDADPD